VVVERMVALSPRHLALRLEFGIVNRLALDAWLSAWWLDEQHNINNISLAVGL
jgi:hypothetical protein